MRKRTILILLAPIPALLIGAIVMRGSGVSAAVYAQNIVCYAVFGLALLFARNQKATKPFSLPVVIAALVAACLLLASTFLDRGVDGVHRWLSIGGFRLYLSSIMLPSVVLMIMRLWQDQHERLSAAMLLVIAALLLVQPDAAQLSAFAAAVGFFVLVQAKNKAIKYALPLALMGGVAYAWMHLDALEAVPHVEGILALAGDMGTLYCVLGFVSLGILLLPFLHFPNASIQAKAVGIYYFVMIAATFAGNFPVPFMGYGVSPIIGYLLAIFLLMRENAMPTHKA